MKALLMLTLAMFTLLAGCTSSPRSQDMVRRSTAAATRIVANDVKGAVLGVRDGLRHDASKDAVDINTASKENIESLSGVTPVMAERVINNRPYKDTGDLLRRRILPQAVYSKVRSRLVAH